MNLTQRVVGGATGAAVAVLAGAFCFMSWDRADEVAGVVSALMSVAGLGVAVWALLSGGGGSVRVANTGPATSRGTGSFANTGLIVSGGMRGDMTVDGTGSADAEDGGRANTGVN